MTDNDFKLIGSSQVVFYSKEHCPYCVSLQNLLETCCFKYQQIKIGEEITKDQVVQAYPLAKTAPVVVVDGNYQQDGYEGFAEQLAIEINFIREKLIQTIYSFYYPDQSGELVIRHVTLLASIAYNSESQPAETSEDQFNNAVIQTGTILCYDVNKNNWRRFKLGKIKFEKSPHSSI